LRQVQKLSDGSFAAPLGQPGHGALEGVAVKVDRSGQQHAGALSICL
jgi:hypothetical protein